jgi:hypothetical protein
MENGKRVGGCCPGLLNVDHFACHTPIGNKDLTRDKRRLIRQQKGYLPRPAL